MQVLHSQAPETVLTSNKGHCWQVEPSLENVPVLHLTHDVRWASGVKPQGHGVHSLAPVLEDICPDGQNWHLFFPSENFPAGQGVHCEAEVASAPAVQYLHWHWPELIATIFGRQAEHCSPNSANVPGPQSEHTVLPLVICDPQGQAEQLLLAGGENVFGGHGTQINPSDDFVFAGHNEQGIAPAAQLYDVTGWLPTGQFLHGLPATPAIFTFGSV
jgi:hypothetical protein